MGKTEIYDPSLYIILRETDEISRYHNVITDYKIPADYSLPIHVM